jgi:hypothetical protein
MSVKGDIILLKDTHLLVILVKGTHNKVKIHQVESEVEEKSSIVWTHRHILLIWLM